MSTHTSSPHLPRARHEHILRELELHGSARCTALAEQLGVTEVTIRRDIIQLSHQGRLIRVRGGALAALAPREPLPARTLLGMVLPASSAHFPDIVRGAEATARAMRSRLTLASTHYDEATEVRQVERLLDLGVSGLLIAPTLRDRSVDDLTVQLDSVPVPVVIVERCFEESSRIARYDRVGTDHARGTVLAIEHLVRQGHDAVGLALLDRTPTAPAIRAGYAAALTRLGLRDAPVTSIPKDHGSAEGVRDALSSFLDRCLVAGVHAALIHTDVHAAHFLEVAASRGISVPKDFAVACYDDTVAEAARVPITAVAPPGHDIGRLAVQTLHDRIRMAGPEPSPPRHVQLLPRLNVRASTTSEHGGPDAGVAPTTVPLHHASP